MQERYKGNDRENGLVEIPAGKIREFENIYDCLRREISEETGLEVTYIQGEEESVIVEHNGYKVLNYTPFSCSQNIVSAFRSSFFMFTNLFIDSPATKVYIRKYVVFGRAR